MMDCEAGVSLWLELSPQHAVLNHLTPLKGNYFHEAHLVITRLLSVVTYAIEMNNDLSIWPMLPYHILYLGKAAVCKVRPKWHPMTRAHRE